MSGGALELVMPSVSPAAGKMVAAERVEMKSAACGVLSHIYLSLHLTQEPHAQYS